MPIALGGVRRHKDDVMPIAQTHEELPTISSEAAKAYQQIVSSARLSQSKAPIPNRYPWHCRIAVNELMNLATSLQDQKRGSSERVVIRILTGTLTKHVYESGLSEIVGKFLSSGGEIRLLIWNTQESVSKSYSDNWLLRTFAKNARFKVKVVGSRDRGEDVSHFFSVGESAYRLEAPHPYVEACDFNDFVPEIPARICFNDPETVSRLADFFDMIWKILPDRESNKLEPSKSAI